MKVLTLKQPWATVIASGIKNYEFRSWKTSYRGPLLIHAGLGIDKEAIKRFEKLGFDYPKAAIICLVELQDCIKVDEMFLKQLLKENELVYRTTKIGEYAWKIKLIKPLFISNIKGKLSLWEYEVKDGKLDK